MAPPTRDGPARDGGVALRAGLLDAAVELMGRSGRGATVRVQGGSMRPTLCEGQLLLVEFAPERPRRGDMLLFRQADYLVVHRVLGAARRGGTLYYRTRGDGTLALDPPVLPERVVGRVVAVRQADRWRSVTGAAARVYGKALAWHDLGWAGAGVLARWADRRLRRRGWPAPLERWAGRADRLLLGTVHAAWFRILHRVIPPPETACDARRPE